MFVERRETIDLRRTRQGQVSVDRTGEAGLSEELEEAPATVHRWRPLRRGEPVPEEVARLLAGEPLGESAVEALRRLAEEVAEAARSREATADVQLRQVAQRVLVRGGADERRSVVMEVRLSVERDGSAGTVQREHAWTGLQAPPLGPELRALLEEQAALADLRRRPEPAPAGPQTIVIPPGADAGVLFHEVCGHPLEGDVVGVGGSYLARALGQRVADGQVTVVDDPTAGNGAVGYALDDEGTPAQAATLIRSGVVAEPMLDSRSARLLSRAPNGHGRRVSYRHPPLPRMSHTALLPSGGGTLPGILAGVSSGLLVRGLTPRHVDLLSGDFSFFIDEARRIEDGRPGAFIGPALLRGNGLAVLGGIEAVGADARPFAGLKGCGKLDHGPLAVSFGNPSVRIRGLTVEPWR